MTCIGETVVIATFFHFLAVSVQTPYVVGCDIPTDTRNTSWQRIVSLVSDSETIALATNLLFDDRRYFFGAAIPPAPLALPVLAMIPVPPAPWSPSLATSVWFRFARGGTTFLAFAHCALRTRGRRLRLRES